MKKAVSAWETAFAFKSGLLYDHQQDGQRHEHAGGDLGAEGKLGFKGLGLGPAEIAFAVAGESADTVFIRRLEQRLRQSDVSVKISHMINKNSDNNESLSEREKDVVISMVQGMTNKEIADHLCISINTVITHRRNIARKLQIHSPAGLTIYAIVNNLVDISLVKL